LDEPAAQKENAMRPDMHKVVTERAAARERDALL
jgi:hypothetical protein